MMQQIPAYAAFRGDAKIAGGPLADVAVALLDLADPLPAVVLDSATGRVVDLDLREGADAVRARYAQPQPVAPPDPARGAEPRGRGRPKLGVTPREVTLLPEHWDWLATQSGGASVALRKLVAQAMRAPENRLRAQREICYRAATVLSGDRPGYEAAMRALYAGDAAGWNAVLADWPVDIAQYLQGLAPGG